MNRELLDHLREWLVSGRRKPVILRGARQVGKTWIVRKLAAESGREFIEVNFERNPELAQVFRPKEKDPRRWLADLGLLLGKEAKPARVFLFLDEIQAFPEGLSCLRWFAEELPETVVVAAGSLLEFALRDYRHSVPVGRVGYMHVPPMRFPEFLRAHGQNALRERLAEWRIGEKISEIIHGRALEWHDRYLMVGGMPEAVAADAGGAEAAECRVIQQDLIQTYRDDFAKYTGRMDPRILDEVLRAAAASLGKKFIYSHVGAGVRHQQAKQALELLAMAQLCDLIPHADANGIPLGAAVNDRLRKVALLDAGLAHGLWKTPAAAVFPRWENLAPQIRGGLIEQGAAQELREVAGFPSGRGSLFHWRREAGAKGEIDLLLELDGEILPVEIKSGASGSMKSLHQFVHDKKISLALRTDRNPPTLQEVRVKTTKGDPVRYNLLNLPPYLLWRTRETTAEVRER